MMRKLLCTLTVVLVSLASHAQFEMSKIYIGGALSSLDLSYNGLRKGHIGLSGMGGYFFRDNLLALGRVGYEKQKDMHALLTLGVGGRYYIIRNGLYLGLSATYKHSSEYNDFLPGVQIGYAFFVSRTVTIEPEIYYDQSFKNHKDRSTVGLRVGVGVYLNNKK